MRDSAGAAVAGARVELWSATAMLAARSTNDSGIVRFAATETALATGGLVRKLGFSPEQFALRDSSGVVDVLLSALVLSMPEVTVRAVADACPQQDQAEARDAWAAAAARYRTPSLEHRDSRMEQHTSVVAEADVGIVDAARVLQGSRGYTGPGMRGGHNRIRSSGYVYQLQPGHNSDFLGAWDYAAVHAELAGHFVTAEFAEKHTFRISRTNSVTTEIRFCARDRRASGLDGTMRISASDGLLDARWRYWNPNRDREPAGGAATFAPAARDGVAGPLFSSSGLIWRRTPSGRYAQRWQRYIEWVLRPDGDVSEAPTSRCNPPANYVLCSATQERRGASMVTECVARPFHCADRNDEP